METRHDVLIFYLPSNHRTPQTALISDPNVQACSAGFKINAITRLPLGFQWLPQETKQTRTTEKPRFQAGIQNSLGLYPEQ